MGVFILLSSGPFRQMGSSRSPPAVPIRLEGRGRGRHLSLGEPRGLPPQTDSLAPGLRESGLAPATSRPHLTPPHSTAHFSEALVLGLIL